MLSVEEAFQNIESTKEGIPFEAIEYLNNHKSTPENELKFALKKLETGEDEYAEFATPYVEQRGPWRAHYKPLEKIFYDDYEPEGIKAPSLKAPTQPPKIGRNEKVSVQYENGMIKRDIKYKKIEDDLEAGECWLID